MKPVSIPCVTLLLLLLACNNRAKHEAKAKNVVKGTPAFVQKDAITNDHDVSDIRNLMRGMLKWADTCKSIDLLPATAGKDSICTGFNFNTLDANVSKLRKTGFFSEQFIENYSHIIRTLDKKIKNHQFEPWNIGELPSFSFANDASPWCFCQDNLSWDDVEVAPVKLTKSDGDFRWNWGKPGIKAGWQDFSRKFSVVKVNDKWMISYLQGFDYTESIK